MKTDVKSHSEAQVWMWQLSNEEGCFVAGALAVELSPHFPTFFVQN